MLNIIKKWWFREWSDWIIDREYLKYPALDRDKVIILRSTSNDGLIKFKKIEE